MDKFICKIIGHNPYFGHWSYPKDESPKFVLNTPPYCKRCKVDLVGTTKVYFLQGLEIRNSVEE